MNIAVNGVIQVFGWSLGYTCPEQTKLLGSATLPATSKPHCAPECVSSYGTAP